VVVTDDKWTLSSCNIKPDSLPFSVDIDSTGRKPVDRDSENCVGHGAYLILKDGWALGSLGHHLGDDRIS